MINYNYNSTNYIFATILKKIYLFPPFKSFGNVCLDVTKLIVFMSELGVYEPIYIIQLYFVTNTKHI